MPVLSDAAGGVEGQSMVEGCPSRKLNTPPQPGYPSTTLRAVPLPLWARIFPRNTQLMNVDTAQRPIRRSRCRRYARRSG
jgi:hypothetical protein